MAKLQTKKLNINDFSSHNREDIGRLARSLNPFFDEIEKALRKGLTVDENLPFEYNSFDISVDANGNPKTSVSIPTSLSTIKGIMVISASATGNYPTATPFISYSISGSVIKITNVKGLPANINFNLTVMVLS